MMEGRSVLGYTLCGYTRKVWVSKGRGRRGDKFSRWPTTLSPLSFLPRGHVRCCSSSLLLFLMLHGRPASFKKAILEASILGQLLPRVAGYFRSIRKSQCVPKCALVTTPQFRIDTLFLNCCLTVRTALYRGSEIRNPGRRLSPSLFLPVCICLQTVRPSVDRSVCLWLRDKI